MSDCQCEWRGFLNCKTRASGKTILNHQGKNAPIYRRDIPCVEEDARQRFEMRRGHFPGEPTCLPTIWEMTAASIEAAIPEPETED